MSRDDLLEKQCRYTQIIQNNPRDASAYFKRGMVRSELGLDVEALEDYSTAISLRPGYTLAYFNRGVERHRRGEYREAIADFDVALALNPDDSQTYTNRGVAYEKLAHYDKALADYEQAIKLSPDSIIPLINRGNAFLHIGDFARSMAAYNDALLIAPESGKVYNARAAAHFRQYNYEAAAQDYEKARQLGYTDAQSELSRGIALDKLGRFEEAVEALTEAIQSGTENAEAYGRRGWDRVKLGRLTDAQSDLLECLRLEPTHSAALFSMGVLLERQGRLRKSVEFFEKAASLGDSGAIKAAAWVRTRLEDGEPENDEEDVDDAASAVHSSPEHIEQEKKEKTVRILPIGKDLEDSGVIYYSPRDGYVPQGKREFPKITDEYGPIFVMENIEPIPFTTFEGYLKCIRPDDLNEMQRAMIEFSFAEFFGEETSNSAAMIELQVRGGEQGIEAPFKYRRFAGDAKLPRGRYYTVCVDETGNDYQTLAGELSAYVDPAVSGELLAFDLSDPRYVKLWQRYLTLFADRSLPKESIAVVYYSRRGVPTPSLTVLHRALGNEDILEIAEAAPEIPFFLPTKTIRQRIPQIIDLRLPETQEWLRRSLVAGIPEVSYIYDRTNVSPKLDVRGEIPEHFVALLPLLMFHYRGGNPLTDAIGSWLRSLGANALIYPSARSDPYSEIVNGQLTDFSGWSLVDYRDAPSPQRKRRAIEEPDSWMELIGGCRVILDPPDSERFGSWRVVNNTTNIATENRYYVELYYQQHYSRGREEVFKRLYHVKHPGRWVGPLSLAEIKATLSNGQLSLRDSVRDDSHNPHIPSRTVGELLAALTPAEPEFLFEPDYHSGESWFLHRLCTSDAEVLVRCPICDFESIWPVLRGYIHNACPGCGFANGEMESLEAIRERFLEWANQ